MRYNVYGSDNMQLASFLFLADAITFCGNGCFGDYINDGKQVIYVSLGRL